MKRQRLFKLLLVFTCCFAPANARAQDATAVAAWQVTRYDITANVDTSNAGERALTARASLAARNVGQGVGRTFTFRLSPSAEVKAATAGDAPAQFVTREEARTKLRQVTVTLPAAVAPSGTVNVSLEYRLPVATNSGLNAISAEGAQFLPLSFWYPTPNTQFAPRGADTAPMRLTVTSAGGEKVVTSGQLNGATYESALNVQPFFLTGRWDVSEGAGEARGISAWLVRGASADERKRADALVALAASARTFFQTMLGPAPESPVRLVAVRRGAGFDMGGTLLLDASVFRRSKTDAATAMQIAEMLARMWIGGTTVVQGEGAGAVREGLARYLATLFIEKQFGRETADAERLRLALAYAPVARRDGPLSQSTPFSGDYYTSVTNKGAMVWRLVAERAVGREAFMNVLRRELETNRGGRTSLASLRAALGERSNESLARVLSGVFDQPTDTDLLVGLPQQRAGEWVTALRNVGSLDVQVNVVATTDTGERLTSTGVLPARDFAETKFKTTARITRVEIDPEKIYPQLDYSNDVAPRGPSIEEALAELTSLFAQQQYARVEELARSLFRRTPQSQEARIWLARSLLEANKTDEAERELRAALELPLPTAATLAWANLGLGEIARRRNQTAEAVKRFDEAARTEADYASTLAARAARIKAETGAAPAVEEAARTFLAQFDAAIQSGRKAALDALFVPGELSTFSRGIVSNQPEAWQTRALRTEMLGTDRMAVDVAITSKVAAREQAGTAVLVLANTPAGWRLADIQFFEVR
ncbi:MAG TPA: tetratricopeptide repeat protein [Pyrinomonadaceae bacterium]|nr:tetratricopeptide repeat protein [Pyrinomonadaceae bacterium]